MNRKSSIAIAATLAIAAMCLGAKSTRAAKPPVAYRVDVQVVHRPNDRQSDALSSPSVITLDRQEASIQAAKAEPITIEGDEVVHIESGIMCRLTPYHLKDGSVKLDIDTDVNLPPEGMPDVGVDLVTKKIGVRRIQKVPLGKRIQIPITPRGQFPGFHLSLLVTKVANVDDTGKEPRDEREVDDNNVFQFFTSGGR